MTIFYHSVGYHNFRKHQQLSLWTDLRVPPFPSAIPSCDLGQPLLAFASFSLLIVTNIDHFEVAAAFADL